MTKIIDWTPVGVYGEKLYAWNRQFDLGLAENRIDWLAANLPDHAGAGLPASITCTLGRGLQGDREVVQQIIGYEMSQIGVPYTDYIREDGWSVAPLPGSEPPDEPQLDVALLDIGTFWDPRNGVVPNRVRSQRSRWPGLEVDWLMALHPQVLNAIDYETVPGFIATGLVVDGGRVPVFGRGSDEACVSDCWDGRGWRSYSVVAFRE